MNNKGLKDQIFTCQNCGEQFPFKGYSRLHKYCSRSCSSIAHARNVKVDYEKLFDSGNLTSRARIYKILVKRHGDRCSVCSITEWNNKPIRLWVDHIDGNAANNSPSNFRLICPNCDCQSETFGARNKGSGRKARGLPQYG